MKNNYIPAIIAAAFSIVAWLFFPFVEINILFVTESLSVVDLLFESGVIIDLSEFDSILILSPVLAGALAVIGGFMKKKGLTLVSSIAGVAAIALIFFDFMDVGMEFSSITELMGAGFWCGLIGLTACAVLVSCVGKREE